MSDPEAVAADAVAVWKAALIRAEQEHRDGATLTRIRYALGCAEARLARLTETQEHLRRSA